MTQYLAHIIMYPYLVVGGYNLDVNDIDKCHRYIDDPATTMVLHEKPDPRLVLYGVSLKLFAESNGDHDSNTKDQSRQHKHKTY